MDSGPPIAMAPATPPIKDNQIDVVDAPKRRPPIALSQLSAVSENAEENEKRNADPGVEVRRKCVNPDGANDDKRARQTERDRDEAKDHGREKKDVRENGFHWAIVKSFGWKSRIDWCVVISIRGRF
jgi:hypothetical protein